MMWINSDGTVAKKINICDAARNHSLMDVDSPVKYPTEAPKRSR